MGLKKRETLPTLRVRHLRRAKGLGQAEVAARARVTQATLSRIESGKLDATLSTLARVAGALGVELWELFRP